jgi:serine/threonine protein kinase
MLGQGAFGVVYLGLNIDSGELMAVKQMATDDVSKRELNSLENEIHLLRNLRHPNIVRYIGTELNSERLSIFLEYVPGGSLKALIDKFGHLEESVARSYTRQLLIGLEYLHRHGIAHRDIKGANCLVGNDGVIKLADFGNSKHWRPPTQTGSLGAAGVGGGGTKGQSSSGDIKGEYTDQHSVGVAVHCTHTTMSTQCS